MSLLWLIYGALTINSVNKQNKYGCKEYMSVFQSLYATLAFSLHTQTAFSFFLLFHLFWSSSAWQVCKYDSQNLFNASSFLKKNVWINMLISGRLYSEGMEWRK